MGFFLNFIKGIFIGVGMIMPGVSGGSLAVIFGIYEKITDLIANVFKDFKRNFKKNLFFILPVALGGGVGVLGFSRIIEYLFANYNAQVKYLFIGLILGTLPLLFRQANIKGFKKTYLPLLALSFFVTVFLAVLDTNAVNAADHGNPGFLLLILYGTILGFGTIIPGISASFILMYLGSYETILRSLSNIDLSVLIPVGIGFVLSIIIFAKLINLLFNKAYGYTYYTILGFVIGSIIPIIPGFAFDLKYLLCIFLLIAGFSLSFSLCKISPVKQ